MVRSRFLIIAVMFIVHQSPASAQQQLVPDNLAITSPPSQPVNYSHRQHIEIGLQCEACHTNPDPGDLMTFPPTAMCNSCHNEVSGNAAPIVALDASAATGEPIAWNRIYRVLEGITWSHRPHSAAGITCEACHGDVSQLDTMTQTTAVTAMASCISCHNAHEAEADCVTCHAWPTDDFLRAHRD